MLAFMGVGTGDVSHTGLVTEQGTVIHSSKSRGGVVETALTAKAGWNGLGVHRMIEVEGSDGKSAGGERAGSAEYGCVIVCAGGGLRMRVQPNGRYMQMIPDGTRLAVLEEKGRLAAHGISGTHGLDQRDILLQGRRGLKRGNTDGRKRRCR